MSVESWQQSSEKDILPPVKRSLLGRIQKYYNEFGHGLTAKQNRAVAWRVAAAHLADKANRLAPVRFARWIAGKSLPPPSEITLPDKKLLYGTAFMQYLSKTERAQRNVRITSDVKFDVHNERFMLALLGTLITSGISAYKGSFDTFLDAFHVPDSNARIPFRNTPEQDRMITNVMILNETGTVTMLRDIPEVYTWIHLENNLHNGNQNNHYANLENFFQQETDLPVHMVINCLGGSELPAYMLHPNAHTGVSIDMNRDSDTYGAVTIDIDHLPGEGTVLNQIAISGPGSLEESFGLGKIPHETVVMPTVTAEFITPPDALTQRVTLDNLPKLPYTLAFIAALYAIESLEPGKAHRLSGPVAMNRPKPFTGDPLDDYRAIRTNRISLFQSDTIQNAELLSLVRSTVNRIHSVFGIHAFSRSVKNPEIIEKAVLFDTRFAVSIAFDHTFRAMKERIAAARNQEGSIEMSAIFYGPYTDQKVTDTLEASVDEETRQWLHSHGVVTSIDANILFSKEQVEAGYKPGLHFTTVNPGHLVLAMLNFKPIEAKNRYMQMQVERLRSLCKQYIDDTDLFSLLQVDQPLKGACVYTMDYVRSTLAQNRSITTLFYNLGLDVSMPPELRYEVSTYQLDYKGATPEQSRERVIQAAHHLSEAWWTLAAIRKHIYAPLKRNTV